MQKTDVYSWRLSPQLKIALEEAARCENKSLGQLLEEIVRDWLEQSHDSRNERETERQRHLQETALKFAGILESGRPDRTESARSELKARIARRHGR
jgi:hypothetical protein